MKKTISELLDIFSKLPRKHRTLLIGIDGFGGSGKSTLARKLRDFGKNITVIEMDDFYRPSAERRLNNDPISIGMDFNWPRMRDQILIPITSGLPGKYQRYDWNEDSLAEWHDVPTGGIVIIEGVYSTRQELTDLYDYKIWVDSPHNIRLARGLERDGEGARDRWEKEWMPAEERYVRIHQPYNAADLIIEGSGLQANLHSNEYFVIQEKNT